MRYLYNIFLVFFLSLQYTPAKAPLDDVLSPLTTISASTTTQKKNEAILASYNQFEAKLRLSDYYTSHSTYFKEPNPGFICPALEYYAFLSSKSSDKNISSVLEYLLKTNGPFIQTKRKATEAENFILKVADASVKKSAGKKIEHSNVLEEEKAFQTIKEKHAPTENLTFPTQQNRWDSLVDMVQAGSFFDSTSFDLTLNQQKLFFTNDLMLLGYSLGLTKRLTPNAAIGTTLGLTAIWQEWGMSNQNMEDAHNYVQVWFPIFSVGLGNGTQSQRLSPTLVYNLENTKCLEYLEQMNRITWARMATFWGQKIDNNKLSTIDPTWHQNWLTHTHNDARMTRILKWLLAFGRDNEYQMMQAYLSGAKKNSIWGTAPQKEAGILKSLLKKRQP